MLLRAAAVLLLYAGCTPSLFPLYQDYGNEAQSATAIERVQRAFTASGWSLGKTEANNVVVGIPRRVRHWGLYRVVVSVEAVVMAEGHVRLFIHPYRHYVTGNRSKIPFLRRSLRRSIVQPLDKAFYRENLIALGTGVYRDRRL